MTKGQFHKSVLLKESLGFLQVKKGKKYIDGTLGGGGHTFEILKLGGKVLGIDLDQDAIDFVSKKWKEKQKELKVDKKNLIIINGNFKDIGEIARINNFSNVDGIILDLGVSSHQIDEAERGFSFLRSGPLDMRMDRKSNTRAMDLVNVLAKGELYDIFSRLGQERRARSISDGIVGARRVKAIETTDDLVEVIREAYGIRKKTLLPFERTLISQKVFQALRILVNNELESLENALPKAIDLLSENGRLLVISFHSLEDRIVKKSFIEHEKKGKGLMITKKPILPSREETENNRRSKSAKLRVFEKN